MAVISFTDEAVAFEEQMTTVSNLLRDVDRWYDLEEASQAISDIIDWTILESQMPGFARNTDETYHRLIKITVGGGKSHQTWKSIAEKSADDPEFRALIRCQSHKKAEETLAEVNEAIERATKGGGHVPVAGRWVGQSSPDPRDTGKKACQNEDLVQTVRKAGGDTSNACELCPLSDACFYRGQDLKRAQIVIVAGDVSLSSVPYRIQRVDKGDDQGDFDLVVVDEMRVSDLITQGGYGTDVAVLTEDVQELFDTAREHVRVKTIESNKSKIEATEKKDFGAGHHAKNVASAVARIDQSVAWSQECERRLENQLEKQKIEPKKDKAAQRVVAAEENLRKAREKTSKLLKLRDKHKVLLKAAQKKKEKNIHDLNYPKLKDYKHSEIADDLHKIAELIEWSRENPRTMQGWKQEGSEGFYISSKHIIQALSPEGEQLQLEVDSEEEREKREAERRSNVIERLKEVKSHVWKAVLSTPKTFWSELDGKQDAKDRDPNAVLAPLVNLRNTVRAIAGILDALIQGMEDAEHALQTGGHRDMMIAQAMLKEHDATKEDTAKLRVHISKRTGISSKLEKTPFIFLDATGDVEMMENFFQGIKQASDIKVRDGAGVRRVMLCDNQMSKTKMVPTPNANQDKAPVPLHLQERNAAGAGLLEHLRTMQTGQQGSLIVHKGTQEWLKERGYLEGREERKTLHYHGNTRGLNDLKDTRHLSIIGRNRTWPRVLERTAQIAMRTPVAVAEIQRYPMEITLRDGRKAEIKVEGHADPNANKMLEILIEQETIQEDGRVRAVRRNEDTPALVTVATSVCLDSEIDEVFTYAQYKAALGWAGGLLVAGVWPSGNGSAGMRVKALRGLLERFPWMESCIDLPGDDQDAKEWFKNQRRSRAVKDLTRAIDEATHKGQSCDVLAAPFDFSSWHRLSIKSEGGRACTCYVAGPTLAEAIERAEVLFDGAEVASALLERIDCDSASCTPEDLGGSDSESIYIPESAPPNGQEYDSGPDSPDRTEPLTKFMSERGFIPLNGAHLVALGAYASRSNAGKAAKDVEPVEGEFSIQYKWASGRQKTKGRAIVRADSIEQAREILTEALPGCELL